MAEATQVEPGALGVEAAARYLGIGRATLYELLGAPDAPPSWTVGRRRLFRRAALDDWMRAREAAQSGGSGG